MMNLPTRIAVVDPTQIVYNGTFMVELYDITHTNSSSRIVPHRDFYRQERTTIFSTRNHPDFIRLDINVQNRLETAFLYITPFNISLPDTTIIHQRNDLYYNNIYNNNFNIFRDPIPIVFIDTLSQRNWNYEPNRRPEILYVEDGNGYFYNQLQGLYRRFRNELSSQSPPRRAPLRTILNEYPDFHQPGSRSRRRHPQTPSRSPSPDPRRNQDSIAPIQIQISTAAPAPPKVSERVALALARDSIQQKEVCPIGQVPLNSGRIAVTSCHCVFQAEMLEPWAAEHTTCPTCRTSLDYRIVMIPSV